MSDHRERSCTWCGSFLHYEDGCLKRQSRIEERRHAHVFEVCGVPCAWQLPDVLPGMPLYGVF